MNNQYAKQKTMLQNIFTKKFYIDILPVESLIFYIQTNRFFNADRYILSAISQHYSNGFVCCGLKFMNAKDIKLLQALNAKSFNLMDLVLEVQGFLYWLLYKTFSLKGLSLLYMFNLFFIVFALIIAFFISLFIANWIAKFAESFCFMAAFLILQAIVALSLYGIRDSNNLSKIFSATLCVVYIFAMIFFISTHNIIASIIHFFLSLFFVGILSILEYKCDFWVLFGFMLTFIVHVCISDSMVLCGKFIDVYRYKSFCKISKGNPKDFDSIYTILLKASVFSVLIMFIMIFINLFACFIESNAIYRNFCLAMFLCFALFIIIYFVFGKSHGYIHTYFLAFIVASWISILYVPPLLATAEL